MPQIRWLITKKYVSLSCECQKFKPKVSVVFIASESCKKNLFPASPLASGGFWKPLAYLNLQMFYFSLCSPCHMGFPLWVYIFMWHLKILVIEFRIYLNQAWPHLTLRNYIFNDSICTECWCLILAILATWEVEIRRTVVQGQPGKISISKNNQSKMDWRFDSSGTVPALQVKPWLIWEDLEEELRSKGWWSCFPT
jgi:hypothetical protein